MTCNLFDFGLCWRINGSSVLYECFVIEDERTRTTRKRHTHIDCRIRIVTLFHTHHINHLSCENRTRSQSFEINTNRTYRLQRAFHTTTHSFASFLGCNRHRHLVDAKCFSVRVAAAPRTAYLVQGLRLTANKRRFFYRTGLPMLEISKRNRLYSLLSVCAKRNKQKGYH